MPVQIKDIREAKAIGKILGNKNKLRMLVELSRTALTKSRLAEIVGITPSTTAEYVRDLVNVGLVREDHVVSGKHMVRVLRMKTDGIYMEFGKLEGIIDEP